MPSFNSIYNSGSDEFGQKNLPPELTEVKSQNGTLSKVFLVLFASLLAIAGLVLGINNLFTKVLILSESTITSVSIITLTVSTIALLVMAFVIPHSFEKNKGSLIASYTFVILCFGLMLSSATIFFEQDALIYTFFLTAGIFGIMALLGFLSKGAIKGIWLTVIGLAIGIITLCIIDLFILNDTLLFGISMLYLALLLFEVMFDVAKISNIFSVGYYCSDSVVFFSALMLLVDFFYIFIRLLRIVAIISSKKN